MDKEPFISVIVPMYKVERYIKVCIDSILTQTFQDFEIIIVDDASPDNCYEICKNLYGNYGNKVRLVRHSDNRGLGAARNTGIKNARGKYIYFVDSDDAIVSDALEKLYNAAETSDADVVHAAGWYETNQDDDNYFITQNFRLTWERHDHAGLLKSDAIYLLTECFGTSKLWVMAWLNMFKREFLENNGLKFLDIISEDEPFSFAVCCLAPKYYVLRDAIYVYRRHESSTMNHFDMKRFSKGLNGILVGTRYIKELMNSVPELAYDRVAQESLMSVFLDRFFSSHIFPFYDGESISADLDNRVFEALLPVFRENTTLVKYLLHLSNIWHRHFLAAVQQNQALAAQFQQLQENLRTEQLKNLFMSEQAHMLELVEELKTAEKRFLFMSSPEHGNLGDQAIVLGEYCIMQSCFPEYKIIEIPTNYLTGELGKLFFGLGYRKYVRDTDAIVLHGGGNLGNIWLNEEIVRRDIIETFPNNRIVSFPQSIHFTDDAEGARQSAESSRIYNAHRDLHLMLRDENSFAEANKLFPKVHTYLVPDIVTALCEIFDGVSKSREGVLFVLRRDKEKIRNDALIQNLQEYLSQNNIPFQTVDTVISDKVTAANREEKIREVLMKFRHSKLVVTDRFHGVIFSVITRTPVVAFKSFDTKISSGIKWFKAFPSVFYAQDEFFNAITSFMSKALNGDFDTSLAAPPNLS